MESGEKSAAPIVGGLTCNAIVVREMLNIIRRDKWRVYVSIHFHDWRDLMDDVTGYVILRKGWVPHVRNIIIAERLDPFCTYELYKFKGFPVAIKAFSHQPLFGITNDMHARIKFYKPPSRPLRMLSANILRT